FRPSPRVLPIARGGCLSAFVARFSTRFPEPASMYAIIADGGRQYKVKEGDHVEIDYRGTSAGEQIVFDRVLGYSDGEKVELAWPLVSGCSVTAEELATTQSHKLVFQKYMLRKPYRRKNGHRQLYNKVKITKIDTGSEPRYMLLGDLLL